MEVKRIRGLVEITADNCELYGKLTDNDALIKTSRNLNHRADTLKSFSNMGWNMNLKSARIIFAELSNALAEMRQVPIQGCKNSANFIEEKLNEWRIKEGVVL